MFCILHASKGSFVYIYKVYEFHPIMTYASAVIAQAFPAHIHRLQAFPNRLIRNAMGVPWHLRQVNLHIDLRLRRIAQFMTQASKTYFDSVPTTTLIPSWWLLPITFSSRNTPNALAEPVHPGKSSPTLTNPSLSSRLRPTRWRHNNTPHSVWIITKTKANSSSLNFNL